MPSAASKKRKKHMSALRCLLKRSAAHQPLHSFPTRRSSDLSRLRRLRRGWPADRSRPAQELRGDPARRGREGPPGGVQHPPPDPRGRAPHRRQGRSEEHTAELQSRLHLVCRLLLQKKEKNICRHYVVC